jgi:hypothetical protein
MDEQLAPLFDNAELPDLAMRGKKRETAIMQDGSHAQLFDLTTKDSGETRNLSALHPEVVRRLKQPWLACWQSCMEANLANEKKLNE